MKTKGPKVIVDNIGSFQVDAQLQWVCNLKAEVFVFCVACMIMLLFFTIGIFYLQAQCDDLKKTQEKIQMEIQNLKILKQETQDFKLSLSDTPNAVREKRESPSRGKSSINGKSKLKKQKKEKDVDQARTSMPASVDVLKARAVHLERDVSYTETGNDGVISHWFVRNWADPAYNLENVLLEGSNSSLVIQNTGLYLIYAQLCYAKTRENNSFEVKVSEGQKPFESKTVSQCSAGTSSLENEITCYTSVVQVLKAGDHVYLQQTQKKRHLLMNRGRSFMGVVKLS